MTTSDTFEPQTGKPKVIIVGAGIAGLVLASLLEKANVPYAVYERAVEVKPLGSALFLACNTASLFKQIGVYDDFVARGKRCDSIDFFDQDRQSTFDLEFTAMNKMGGSEGFIISRLVLYDILLKQVPADRIHFGKKVLSTLQGENGVLIRCSDGTTVEGDILVGADGAYSGVRQSLYERLKKEGKLPVSDGKPLPYTCVCLVGQTALMDPAKMPELNDSQCHFNNILSSDKPYSWMVMTTPKNVVCWSVIQYLDEESSKANDSFRNSEWGPEGAVSMCKEVRDFAIPGGDGTLTLGDLLDLTPKERISKVMLEEKVFDTWYSGRTVLLGDACHKTHVAGGQGAMSAIHDAVALANWINVLPSKSVEDAEQIFKQYKAERYPAAKAAYDHGRHMALTSATSLKAKLVRFVTKNMPWWLWKMLLAKNSASRPQVSFLPLIDDKGTVAASHQPSLVKTLAILEAKKTSQTVR